MAEVTPKPVKAKNERMTLLALAAAPVREDMENRGRHQDPRSGLLPESANADAL